MKNFYKEAEEFYRSKGWGLRMGFGERPAIVAIDLCKAWLDSSNPLGSATLESVVENSVKIIDIGREVGVPIFFTAMSYDPEGSEAFGPRQKKQAHRMNTKSTWARESSAVELDPRLKRRPEEIFMHKQKPSIFWGTPFISYLIGRQVDTLIILGCSTSGCVRASASDAHDYNFYTIVVREAVGERCQMAHEANLIDIDLRYADVISMDEVTAYLKRFKKS